MATREKPLSPSRRLEKSLPKLSPLMREAYASLWTDEQCDAWGRRTRAAEVLKQANEWLLHADRALKKPGAEDVPYSRQRLAWVASLAVAVENELHGVVSDALSEARRVRDEALAAGHQLKGRAFSRASLLVGGNEQRGAALAIANRGSRNADELAESLGALSGLLAAWRKEARLRLLADELGLDEGLIRQLAEAADTLKEAELNAVSLRPQRGDGPALNRLEGRLLRELRALQLAFAMAHEEKLNVPTLRVRPSLRSVFSNRNASRDKPDVAPE